MTTIDPLFGDAPRPLLFAHRGCSGTAPENTMPSFELALDNGIPGIELDVHLCASGEVVVIHDADTGRVAEESLVIEESTFTDLRRLDIGGWKGPSWSGACIPRLEEVLDLVRARVYLDIEIKNDGHETSALEERVVEIVRREADPSWILLSSFNPLSLKRVGVLAPEYHRAIIYDNGPDLPWYLHRGGGRLFSSPTVMKPSHRACTPLGFPGKKRRPYIPWTVDTPELAARLIGDGAEGIISNVPESLGL